MICDFVTSSSTISLSLAIVLSFASFDVHPAFYFPLFTSFESLVEKI